MNLAIYIRVSRRDLNPENQEDQLVDYCRSKHYQYEVFKEIESTRKTRPIKQEVLKLIREGKYDGVLVWKLDRWGRSLQELIMDIDEITNRKKEFIVLTQPIDTTTASGRLFLQILGSFAEFEREIIRERTIAGLDRARKRGVKLGRPKKHKEYLIPDINNVQELLGKGYNPGEIAKLLKTSKYRIDEALDTIRVRNVKPPII